MTRGSDRLTPAHARKLHALAAAPKQSLWVEGAGHNDLVRVAGEGYGAALHKFAALPDQASARPPSR